MSLSPKVYRPRMYAELFVPFFGKKADKQDSLSSNKPIRVPFAPRSATLEMNDHNHADTLRLGGLWKDTGVDPRVLSSARAQFYLGTADENGSWKPSRKDLRFVGLMTKPGRSGEEDGPFSVEIEFHDYTSFFLNQRRFSAAGVPALSDTLPDAWRKICDYVGYYDVGAGKIVSSVADLKDAIVFSEGVDPSRPIGSACAARFKSLGQVQVKPESDAWAVWNQCCGMLGLITYFKLDQLIVTTATDYYTLDNPPVFVWGGNIKRWSESGDSSRTHKGVGITSYDPLAHTILEGFYPPPGDPRVVLKRPSAKKAKAAQNEVQSEDYEMFAVPGLSTQAAVDTVAQRAFEEYSRQSVEGSFTTSEMFVSTVADADPPTDAYLHGTSDGFDILSLGAGDALQVVFKADEREKLGQDASTENRVAYLKSRGYSDEVAQLMAENFDATAQLGQVYHAKCVRASLDTDDSGGRFEVEVNYCNLINPIAGTTE